MAVGATAAIGSLLNALVFRRLAVPNPGQLVALSAFEPRASVDGSRVETRSGVSEEAVTETVSPDYFDMAGARPSAGRFFNESDDAVAVISEQYRRRLFGTDSGLGELIKVASSINCSSACETGDFPVQNSSEIRPSTKSA